MFYSQWKDRHTWSWTHSLLGTAQVLVVILWDISMATHIVPRLQAVDGCSTTAKMTVTRGGEVARGVPTTVISIFAYGINILRWRISWRERNVRLLGQGIVKDNILGVCELKQQSKALLCWINDISISRYMKTADITSKRWTIESQ